MRGVLLRFDTDEMRDIVFLQPQWVVNAMKQIVRHNIGEGPAFTRFANAGTCYDCGGTFSKGKRRHYCHACGESFCAEHCGARAQIAEYGRQSNVRICDTCTEALETEGYRIHSEFGVQRRILGWWIARAS